MTKTSGTSVLRVDAYARLVQAASAVIGDARDQGRDDCMDDLVDEQHIERLRNAIAALDAISEPAVDPATLDTVAWRPGVGLVSEAVQPLEGDCRCVCSDCFQGKHGACAYGCLLTRRNTVPRPADRTEAAQPTFRRLARNAVAGFVDGEGADLYERAIESVQEACRLAYERGQHGVPQVCSDPSCGAPCGACWKRAQRRERAFPKTSGEGEVSRVASSEAALLATTPAGVPGEAGTLCTVNVTEGHCPNHGPRPPYPDEGAWENEWMNAPPGAPVARDARTENADELAGAGTKDGVSCSRSAHGSSTAISSSTTSSSGDEACKAPDGGGK